MFYDKDKGFKAGGPVDVAKPAPLTVEDVMPPVDPLEAPLGVDPDTGEPIIPETSEPLPPEEEPATPPTTLDYADMMRHEIGTATDIGGRDEAMRAIRESMVDQGLTTENEFNRIGRQMLSDNKKQKAADHIAYLRSPEGSDWVKTPGLDSLAALQDAPFGTGTALRGSVGGLKDASRQLESEEGRLNRHARQLANAGHLSEAGKVRAYAGQIPSRGGITTQREWLKEEEKKRELTQDQENRRNKRRNKRDK